MVAGQLARRCVCVCVHLAASRRHQFMAVPTPVHGGANASSWRCRLPRFGIGTCSCREGGDGIDTLEERVCGVNWQAWARSPLTTCPRTRGGSATVEVENVALVSVPSDLLVGQPALHGRTCRLARGRVRQPTASSSRHAPAGPCASCWRFQCACAREIDRYERDLVLVLELVLVFVLVSSTRACRGRDL